jgi:hypothetical protein
MRAARAGTRQAAHVAGGGGQPVPGQAARGESRHDDSGQRHEQCRGAQVGEQRVPERPDRGSFRLVLEVGGAGRT